MCSLKLMVFFLTTLLSIVLSEEYLYENGKILYKQRGNRHKTKILETMNVKYIDEHLIPNVYAMKVDSTIPVLYNGAIRNMPALKNLSLPSCKIREISPGAFKELPKLKNLHLQDNRVEVIEEGVFNNLNVENLYLQRNIIHTIRSGAFDNMPLLRRIHLNNNSLSFWDNQWFKNTPNLVYLHFRRNKITELPESAFTNLGESHKDGLQNTVIYLSKNLISHIHPRAFENVYDLKELWLDKNKIERIDKDVFAHFREIQKLCLHKNNITEIDKDAFRELKNMFQLNLSLNRKLHCLDYEVIVHVRKVIISQSNLYCTCLRNLRDQLNENKLSQKVKIVYDICLDETTEDEEA